MSHCGRAGRVRNEGIIRAQYAWIAFLDSDDVWYETKLEEQYAYAVTQSYKVVHTRERWLRNHKEVSQKKQIHKRQGDIFVDAVKKCIMGPSTLMVHTSVLQDCGMFDPSLEIAEDYELGMRICNRYPIGFIDKPLTVKRAGKYDQLSSKYAHIEDFRIKALLPLVKRHAFTDYHMYIAKKELARKTSIWNTGRDKRRYTS